MWIWGRMEKFRWLHKVTNEEVLGSVNEDRIILNSIRQRKHRILVTFWDKTGFHKTLLKPERKVNQHKAGEEFKRYAVWQMITATLHSNEQQRTEKRHEDDTTWQDTRLTAIFQDNPVKPVPERLHSGFYWS